MKKVRLWLLVFLCMMAVFQVLLTEELLESAHRRNCFSYETAFRNLRNHNLTKDQVNTFFNNAGSDMEGFCELLTMYFALDCQMTDTKLLKKQVADAKKYRGNEFTEINGYVKSVWSDLLCFPVGKITLYLKIAGCRAGLLAATADMREPISWHRKMCGAYIRSTV